MKAFLISAGLLSLAIWMKFSYPIAVNEVPTMWSFAASWMKPPYLYIIINCIIITIVASSRFQKFQTDQTHPTVRSEHLISLKTDQSSDYASLTSHPEISNVVVEYMPTVEAAAELKHVMVTSSSKLYNETEEETMAKYEDEDEDEDEAEDVYVDSIFTYNTLPHEGISSELLQLEYPLPVREKPLISSRFGHRKPIRTSAEGVRSLRVPRPKQQETLDSIWKMITEERHVPLTRHLKKPDTWEHQGRHLKPVGDHVPKSETFKDWMSNGDSPPSSSLRKEPSPSQDELNRRAEAFIKKCKYDMKLQRQKSLNQYMEN